MYSETTVRPFANCERWTPTAAFCLRAGTAGQLPPAAASTIAAAPAWTAIATRLTVTVAVPLAARLGLRDVFHPFRLRQQRLHREAQPAAFVPVDQLPDWMQVAAAVNPLTYLSDAIRGAYTGSVPTGSVLIAVACTVALIAVTQLLTIAAERSVAARA